MKFTHQQLVNLLCLYHDLQHWEEAVWGSSLYIEVNNRDDSVQDNWDDNRSDHRISRSRDVSGERKRIGTAEDSGVWGLVKPHKILWNTQRNFQKRSTYGHTQIGLEHSFRCASNQSQTHSRTLPHNPQNPFQNRYHKTANSLLECNNAEEETRSRLNV